MSELPAVPEGAATPHAAPVPGTIAAYRGAHVLFGPDLEVREDLVVLTDGPKISGIVSTREFEADRPDDVEIIDVSDGFLLPGLIDSHQHLATPPDRALAERILRRQVYNGITSIRDMADDVRQMADLARAAFVGEIPAPDIHYAALMAGPSFFDDPRTHSVTAGLQPGQVPWMRAIDATTDIVEAVTLARGSGAVAIKLYTDLPTALIEVITREAHAQGLSVWAHATVFPSKPSDVVGAGVDVISHVGLLSYELDAGPVPQTYRGHNQQIDAFHAYVLAAPENAFDPLLDRMRAQGTVLDATANLTARGGTGSDAAKAAGKVLQRAHARGVTLSAGTDFEADASSEQPALFDELEFLVHEMGLSVDAVLHAATIGGARSLAGESARRGCIRVGAAANLVVVDQDPRVAIENLRTVRLTVKRGSRFQRTDFTALANTTEGQELQ